MALSEELKEIYSSNVVTQRVYDAVKIYHPLFTEEFYLIADVVQRDLQVEDEENPGEYITKTFQPFGFSISRPAKGSNQQDMQFTFSNVAQIGIQQLELAAEDMDTPISLTFWPYIDGDTMPQSDGMTLELTNVSATAISISGTAARINLYGRKVPSRTFDSWIFKGVA